MKVFAWIAAAIVGFFVLMTFALASALGGGTMGEFAGAFPTDIDIGLDPEQVRNATISFKVADELHAPPLAVMAMGVAGFGESGFQVKPNAEGSGYCGVFQADPDNILCDDTEQQARSFLKGGLGFQEGGAIHLAHTRPSLSPGTIAYLVEGSRQNFSSDAEASAFYDVHRPEAERLISAWQAGGQLVASDLGVSSTVSAVLNNPHIILSPGQQADLKSGGIDQRIIDILAWMGERHVIIVTALRKDHKPGTNHEAGRAVDIGAVDRWICRGGTNDPCATLVRELAAIKGRLRSTELIYLWDPDPSDPNMFARADHDDHFHVAWDQGR